MMIDDDHETYHSWGGKTEIPRHVMLVMIINNKHTRSYIVWYGSVNPSELDDPDTTSVVVSE